jgi:phosphoglucomutase
VQCPEFVRWRIKDKDMEMAMDMDMDMNMDKNMDKNIDMNMDMDMNMDTDRDRNIDTVSTLSVSPHFIKLTVTFGIIFS